MRGCVVGCALLLVCCAQAPPQRPATAFTDALLAAANSWSEQPYDSAAIRTELDRMAAGVQRAIAADGSRPASEHLTRVIFGELGFAREVDDPDLRYVLLPSVLQARKGSCVGLGSLALALAERLHVPLEPVMMPGHFFVRTREAGQLRNLELLRGGEVMPDGWYAARYPIAGGAAPAYTRALSPAEVRGVVDYNAGNQSKRQGRLLDAERAYQAAIEHFPQLAEAHASLGAVAQLLGALDGARLHYRDALRTHPQLPGIADNLRLLEVERSQQRRRDR